MRDARLGERGAHVLAGSRRRAAATSSRARAEMRASCSRVPSPSALRTPSPVLWRRLRPATRTMKNSSRLLAKMARNFARSSSGCAGSCAELEHAGVEVEPGHLAVEEPVVRQARARTPGVGGATRLQGVPSSGLRRRLTLTGPWCTASGEQRAAPPVDAAAVRGPTPRASASRRSPGVSTSRRRPGPAGSATAPDARWRAAEPAPYCGCSGWRARAASSVVPCRTASATKPRPPGGTASRASARSSGRSAGRSADSVADARASAHQGGAVLERRVEPGVGVVGRRCARRARRARRRPRRRR